MANPGRTDHGRLFLVSVDLCPVDLYAPRSPGPPTSDTGRARRRRAGRFVQLRKELPAENTSVLRQWSNIDSEMKHPRQQHDIHDSNMQQLCAVSEPRKWSELAWPTMLPGGAAQSLF